MSLCPPCPLTMCEPLPLPCDPMLAIGYRGDRTLGGGPDLSIWAGRYRLQAGDRCDQAFGQGVSH